VLPLLSSLPMNLNVFCRVCRQLNRLPTRCTIRETAWHKSVPTLTRPFRHALLLAAFACGAGFYHAAWQAEQRLAVSLADEWQGRDIEVIGVVAELPRRYERGLRFSFVWNRPSRRRPACRSTSISALIPIARQNHWRLKPGTLAAHIAPQAAAWRGQPARL